MKNLKLVVALVVMTAMVVSLGFAGMAKKGVTATTSQVRGQRTILHGYAQDSDRPGPVKSTAASLRTLISKNPTLAKPVPEMKKLSSVTSGLSGVYHIPGDFPDLVSAAAVVNFIGLSGPTTFELDATSYTEYTATFGSYPGNSNTLTISPGAGVAAVINVATDSTHGKGLAFIGAKNITVDGLNTGGSSLSIQFAGGYPFPLNDPFGAGVYIAGNSDHIAIKNASVQGVVNNAVWANQTDGRAAIFVFSVDADAGSNTNITLDHLTLTNADYGIKALSELGNFDAVDGFTVTNNHIGGAYGNPVVIGAFAQFCSGVDYANNIVDGVIFLDTYWNVAYTDYDVDQVFTGGQMMFNLGQSTGGHWHFMDNSVFHDNIWRNVSVSGVAGEGLLTYGERIYAANLGFGGVATAYNNRVYNISNPGGAAAQINGMRGPTTHVWHNSVHLTGTTDASTVTNCINNGGGDIYNNAVENSITGGTSSNTRGIAAGGTIDYNAINSTGRFISGFSTAAAAVAAGNNGHGTFGSPNFTADLHITSGPSAAENIGKPELLAANDIDGDARDTTFAGTRDAGADQFPATGSPFGPDVFPASISNPLAGGVPAGLALAPTVVVKNNSNTSVGSFNLNLTITDGYNQTVVVGGIPSHGELTVTFPNWTPPAGSWTITATSSLGGDVNPGNDVLSRGQTVQPPVALTTDTTYTWDSGDQGWTRTVDFQRSSSFTKLGGPLSGSSMVTISPGNAATYTEGAYANNEGYSSTYPGANMLVSPWYDLSALSTDVYVSLSQSIAVEPGWDGAWIEYTTDGVHWKHLGAANDGHGINWYNTSVYQNSPSWDASGGGPPDTATMALYGVGTAQGTTLPMGWWTSNGPPGPPVSVAAETGAPQGPFGYVFAQLHMTAATYPDIVGAPLVKFRYVAFSDAVNPPGSGNNQAASAAIGLAGWAVDNLHIGPHGAAFSGDTLSGNVFTDVNGNGVNDAEPAEVGLKVYLSYFGVLKDSAVTDGAGAYQFVTALDNSGLPGIYNVKVVKAGAAFTVPFNSAVANLSAPGSSSHIVQNFGTYTGSITGHVYSDLNNNGANDSEPGLFNWTVTAHFDSATGGVAATTNSDNNGLYSMVLPPHNYVVVLTQKPNNRPTNPSNDQLAISISGNSGSGTAVLTAQDFGQFVFAIIRVVAAVDVNGDGIKQPTDFAALTTGATQLFNFYHNGVLSSVDTVGNTLSFVAHNVDTGAYSVKRVSLTPPAGWLKTSVADSFSFTVLTGANVDTAASLYFKTVSANGRKFNDILGTGVDSTAWPGVAGWNIHVSGNGGGTVVTDGSGNWTITTLGPGSHTVTEDTLAGWTPTFAAAGLTFTANSGNINSNNKFGLDFGNFRNVNVGGTVYRDRNKNGVRDGGEEAVSGVTVHLTGQADQVTDANGAFTFPGVGPGTNPVSLSVAPPAGYVATSGPYSVALTSGDTTKGAYTLGVFNSSDSVKYRTFTSAQLLAGASTKIQKAWTAKKPSIPTLANALNSIFLVNSALVKEGISGQMNPSGKEYAYILPAKYTDVFATFSAKGVGHSGLPRGLDVDAKGSLLLKKLKSLPETKKNDVLVADLLALKVNIASGPIQQGGSGIGNFLYHEAGNPLSGKTVAQIGASCDTVMTLWQGIPYTTYLMYDTVIAKINAAFSDGSTVPLDTAVWRLSGATATVKVTGVASVYQVSFLSANPGVAPTQSVGTGKVVSIPVSYKLEQNYPNPFNPTTSITFEVPGPAVVTIKVYNMLGQEVATLLNNQVYDIATRDNVDFNAGNIASGVYFYRISAQSLDENGLQTGKSFTQVKKMLLVK